MKINPILLIAACFFIFFVLLPVFLLKNQDQASSGPPKNQTYGVHLILEYDGCKVYQFTNTSASGTETQVYFSKCQSDQPNRVN